MECVKMGRIPKKVKEKALRDHHRYQENQSQQQIEENSNPEVFDDDEITDFQNTKKESISSSSSYSLSSTSSMNIGQSMDLNQEIIIIPPSKSIVFRFFKIN